MSLPLTKKNPIYPSQFTPDLNFTLSKAYKLYTKRLGHDDIAAEVHPSRDLTLAGMLVPSPSKKEGGYVAGMYKSHTQFQLGGVLVFLAAETFNEPGFAVHSFLHEVGHSVSEMAYVLKAINKSDIYDLIVEAGENRPYWFECFAEEFAYFLHGESQWISDGVYKIRDAERRHGLYEIIFNLWRNHVKSGLVKSMRKAGNKSIGLVDVILQAYNKELHR